jgi:hypothetical protein
MTLVSAHPAERERDRRSHHSSFYEQLVEHVFVSELLQELWFRHELAAEVLRSEIDASGYDLALECNGILRHVQLKTSGVGAKASYQKVNVALASKPCGCVIWLIRHEDPEHARIRLSYLFFGASPGQCLPDISGFKIAKHSRANAQGFKAERPAIRQVPKSQFRAVSSTSELVELLFGVKPSD